MGLGGASVMVVPPTRGTLALAVTGFVIAEKCSDQLRVDMGGDHSMSPFD
jgi:hypothetical protein